MIEQFLFAHPALLEAYLWLDLPFLGAGLGLVFGFIIRRTHVEFVLEKVMTGTFIGTIVGNLAGTAILIAHYRTNPIYWNIITSEDYLVRSAATLLVEIVLIQLVMNIVVKYGKPYVSKHGYINKSGDFVEEA